MTMKVTLAEFMGVSEEWLAGYEAAIKEREYVNERTCKLEEPDDRVPMTLLHCSACGMKTAVAYYCSWCGAKVVD